MEFVSTRKLSILHVHFDFVIHLWINVFAESASNNTDDSKGKRCVCRQPIEESV
jgi:hypothetical protein